MCGGSVTAFLYYYERSAVMKLTYPICCGVDVHKTFLVATIITSNYESPKYKQIISSVRSLFCRF